MYYREWLRNSQSSNSIAAQYQSAASHIHFNGKFCNMSASDMSEILICHLLYLEEFSILFASY